MSQFFPPPGGQTITLAAFLNSIASALAQLSAASELLSAFSAFDDDDNGQVDLAELREAVLNTATEPGVHRLSEADVAKIMSDFTARREFTRSMTGKLPGKKGDVFKYRDFVGSITGGNGTSEAPEEPVDREG